MHAYTDIYGSELIHFGFCSNQDFKATGCKQHVQDLLLPSSMRNFRSGFLEDCRDGGALGWNQTERVIKEAMETLLEVRTGD